MALSEELQGVAAGPSPISRLLGSAPRPLKVIAFPGPRGKGAQVGLWCLVDHETRRARLDAIKYLTDVCKLTEVHLASDASLGEEETRTQVLALALRDPEQPLRPFAAHANELRILLTPDERDALYTAYLEFLDERSPLRRVHSAEELEELVTALVNPYTGGITLSGYDSASLRSIARSLADRCATLTKRHSSDTSPSTDSSPLAAAVADEV